VTATVAVGRGRIVSTCCRPARRPRAGRSTLSISAWRPRGNIGGVLGEIGCGQDLHAVARPILHLLPSGRSSAAKLMFRRGGRRPPPRRVPPPESLRKPCAGPEAAVVPFPGPMTSLNPVLPTHPGHPARSRRCKSPSGMDGGAGRRTRRGNRVAGPGCFGHFQHRTRPHAASIPHTAFFPAAMRQRVANWPSALSCEPKLP